MKSALVKLPSESVAVPSVTVKLDNSLILVMVPAVMTAVPSDSVWNDD